MDELVTVVIDSIYARSVEFGLDDLHATRSRSPAVPAPLRQIARHSMTSAGISIDARWNANWPVTFATHVGNRQVA